MADDLEDPYAFIIDHCCYSSSQEEFLRSSNFAREDDTTAGESPPGEYSGRVILQSYGGDDSTRRGGGELVPGDGGCAELSNLGFGDMKEGFLKLGEIDGEERGNSTERRSIEQELNKIRVLEGGKGGSPLMRCSGRLVIEGEVIVFDGDPRVEIVSPLRCVAPDSLEGSGGGEMVAENRVRKKLDFRSGEVEIEIDDVLEEGVVENEKGVDTEVIKIDEEEEGSCARNDVGMSGLCRGDDYDGECSIEEQGMNDEDGVKGAKIDDRMSEINKEIKEVELQGKSKKVFESGRDEGENLKIGEQMSDSCKVDEKHEDEVPKADLRGNGMGKMDEGEKMKRKGKRKLPQSMFEDWGDQGQRIPKCESNDAKESRNEKCEDDGGAFKCILDMLKVIVGDKGYGDDCGNNVDFMETAMRRGMTFPRPRFWPKMEGN